MLLDPDSEAEQSQNLIDRSLAESLSFHKIWFKFVNNFSRYPAHRQTDRRTRGIALPPQLHWW